MSTNAIIAILDDEGGYRGRYLHSDGDRALRVIGELVKTHGVDQVIQTVVEDNLGWSTLEGAKSKPYPWHESDPRFVFVPGFGVAYTKQQWANMPGWDGWITDEREDWVYILLEETVSVVHANEPIAVIRYTNINATSAKQIEESVG